MKTLFLALLILSMCSRTDSKVDPSPINFHKDGPVKVEMDAPTIISWILSQDVKKYYIYCKYDHDDTSLFIIDSVLRGDNNYKNSYYVISREAVTEKLSHSCEGDSLFFIIMKLFYDDGKYENNTRFFIDSDLCYSDWILWKSGIVPLKPYPIRQRWFEE